TGATNYDYCYDTSNDNACSGWTSNGTSTSKALSGLSAETTYYWHVRATNSGGTTYSNGSNTAFWSFTTAGLPLSYFNYLPMVINDTNIVVPPDPILNGDFESGPVNWVEYSEIGYWLVTNSPPDTVTPHSGSWLAWLGGEDNETAWISQSITVPVGRSVLHYWYWIGSIDYCGYDFFKIYVNGTPQLQWDLCESLNTYGWEEGTLDLTAWAGTGVTLKFEVTTDFVYSSAILLDDISLEATTRTSESILIEGVNTSSIMRH
ncbi:MAG: hypothetical protein MUO40_02675, partial [Anaerolineaceae bacterium]|nr:hypothetical protein [Anaerolineaceae bacterium]